MALLGTAFPGEVGLRLLLSPLGSNVVMRTACCAVGIGLPVYSTFKAVEKKDQSEQDKWLLYWAAYGSFSIVEAFAERMFSWIPFYYHVKFAFLVWLQFPSNNGSKHLYGRYLRPFLLKHQGKIDRLLKILSKEFGKFMSSHKDEIHFIENMAVRGATTANYIVNGVSQPVLQEGGNVIEGPISSTAQQTHHSDTEAET